MIKEVVVIGGGAAGTTAANSLRRLGYKVTYKQNGKTEVIVADGVACATTASVASRVVKNLVNSTQ